MMVREMISLWDDSRNLAVEIIINFFNTPPAMALTI